MIFDLVCSQYGWTLDEFRRQTPRTIGIALRRIDLREYNRFAMQARLFGAKIPLKSVKSKAEEIKLKPGQEAAIDAAYRRTQERFKERGRRKRGG